MTLPFQPEIFGLQINVHLILEYLGFFVGFQYYRYLRKQQTDEISSTNRLSIIVGAIFGALIGSRLIGFLEAPFHPETTVDWIALLNVKTIMGGLFGGLLGVELAKKIIGETSRSGDLFTFPIIAGIFIGRIGCFLTGINEFTYGKVTTFFTGMNLGDGLLRHPTSLYELFFLVLLFIILKRIQRSKSLPKGHLFQWFMITYFTFRFIIEFLKPNTFFIFGLSTIQWLCVTCWVYYWKTILTQLHE